MEIVQELQTRDDIKAKVNAAFGFNQPNPEDLINREDFSSDAEYALALARTAQLMNSPEYRAAIRKASVVRQQEDEREIRKREREQLAKIRKSVSLDELDQKNIDAEAQRLSELDLAEGKISPSQFGKAILRHAEELKMKRLDEKAQNRMINAMFRAEGFRNTFTD